MHLFATSRERLGIDGEYAYSVRPRCSELRRRVISQAVQLLLDRACTPPSCTLMPASTGVVISGGLRAWGLDAFGWIEVGRGRTVCEVAA